MKKFELFFILMLCTLAIELKGQTSTSVPKHGFSLGPMFGYDYKLKGPTLGAGLIYEYKPFQRLGFTAGFNYELTRKNLPNTDYNVSDGGVLTHQVYSLSLGARYYLNSLYIGGALGFAHESGKSLMNDGTKYDGGSANSLYKVLGLGYQLPLRNGDLMEFELGTFGTKNSMKLGGTVRYKILR